MVTVPIVDDSLFMRSLEREVLANSGYEVVGEAGDGARESEFSKDKAQEDSAKALMTSGNSIKFL